jgi:hypothetical protein
MLGSPRVLGGPVERFFAPLLGARRAAARAQRWQDRLSAFDGDRLEATLRAVTDETAAELHPDSAPDRRATAARLGDAFGSVFAALHRADEAATGVRGATDDGQRRLAWELWIRQLASVFAAADLAVEAAGAILGGDALRESSEAEASGRLRRVKSS